MIDYQYYGRNSQGVLVEGRLKAQSADALASRLAQDNILLIEAAPYGKAKFNIQLKRPQIFKRKVKLQEMQLFCRQMQTLLKAGIPVVVATQRLAETTTDKYFAEVLKEVLKSLSGGRMLHQSMEQFPHVFSSLFINIVKVGENTGRLDTAFFHLSEYLNLDIDTRKRVTAALRYPLMVIAAGLVALFVINVMVIPNFIRLFKAFKGELPLATRMLINTSYFLSHYWYLIIFLVSAFIISLKIYMHTQQGRIQIHRILLKTPIFGWILHRIYLSRFCRLYALILKSGITALAGVDMVAKATGNAYIASKINDITALIARGNSISLACRETQLFSPLVIQMIMLGEETGNLDNLLDDVADYYEREVSYDLARLADLIEPILLIFMAAMVLILALGVFLPMWDMINAHRGR